MDGVVTEVALSDVLEFWEGVFISYGSELRHLEVFEIDGDFSDGVLECEAMRGGEGCVDEMRDKEGEVVLYRGELEVVAHIEDFDVEGEEVVVDFL